MRDIIIPLTLPPGTVLCDPKTGDRYDHEGKKLDRRISEQRGQMKTPHDLACAISALINSSPRSPTIAELEGVIGEHWKPVCVGGVRVEPRGLAKVSLSDHRELAKRINEILKGAPAKDPPMTVVVERTPRAWRTAWFKPSSFKPSSSDPASGD